MLSSQTILLRFKSKTQSHFSVSLIAVPKADQWQKTTGQGTPLQWLQDAQQLAGTAGACRFVWNYILARTQQEYAAYQAGAGAQAPRVTFFSLGKDFTALRREPRYAWLQEYSFGEVRYVLKYLADAYQAFFQGTRAYPRFQSRHRRQDGFTIPEQVQVRAQHLRVPRLGWLRLQGSNPYAYGQVRQARVRQEGTQARPQWYVYLTYAVAADSVCPGAATGVLGLDRNVGQVTDSEGTVYRMTDLRRLEAKVARKQRQRARRIGGQLQKLRRRQKRIRSNDTLHISRALADQAHTWVVEDADAQYDEVGARHPGQSGYARQGQGRLEPQYPGQQLGPAGPTPAVQV